MLEELRIQNFAIIDQLELTFDGGFNVITGETGAGKSIIIDALELLLGSKVEPTLVRAGAEKALVEGVFILNERARALIVPLLIQHEMLDDDEPQPEYITLSREVRRNGRSSARINGVVVNSEIMREVGEILIDIHGQSAHMSLFRPRAHTDLLDKYANLLEVRSALSKVVHTLSQVRTEIHGLEQDKADLQRRADRLRYDIDEIEAAALNPNEETELVAERNRLANSEQLAKLTSEIDHLLNGNEREGILPAVDAVVQVAALMSKLMRLDPLLHNDYQLAEEISANAQELALTISNYADKIEFSPKRLDVLEERLELIKTLKRRYKVETIEAVLEHARHATEELSHIEHSEERLEELHVQEEKLLRHIGELCLRIHRARENAGKTLARRIEGELKDLRMERTQFEVALTLEEDPQGCYVDNARYAFDTTGMDKVEFIMSANPGEPLRPIAKIASGGEAARIMLALKRVLSQADDTPILIFDEIDTGIGGRIGSVIGEKLWTLTDGHQVMVVTHLPQLAGFADKHYHVRKSVQGERTSTFVTALDEEKQRITELAAMLGAEGEAGIESARGILEGARVRKYEIKYPKQEKLI